MIWLIVILIMFFLCPDVLGLIIVLSIGTIFVGLIGGGVVFILVSFAKALGVL